MECISHTDEVFMQARPSLSANVRQNSSHNYISLTEFGTIKGDFDGIINYFKAFFILGDGEIKKGEYDTQKINEFSRDTRKYATKKLRRIKKT